MSDRRNLYGGSPLLKGLPQYRVLSDLERSSELREEFAGKPFSIAEMHGGTGESLLSLDPTLVRCDKCKGACDYVDGEDSWPCRNCNGTGLVPATTKTLASVKVVNELPEQTETEWAEEFFAEEC